MTIWAFNKPRDSTPLIKYVTESLANGESRFGWGFADLRSLQEKKWAEMNEMEKTSWHHSHFLLGVKPGDWVVHVNIPDNGICTAAQVSGDYRFVLDSQIGDFGHCFPIDPATKLEFKRDDPSIHPRVTRSLKPRRRYQRVYYVNEFLESIARYTAGGITLPEGDSKGKYFLREELAAPLQEISSLIHRNHPSKALEYLVCEIFRTIPGVTKAKVNGSGYGTDYGADVIVYYQTGLPVADLLEDKILVVQVKSYGGKIHARHAIGQLQTAIDQFKAHAAMLISTAPATEEFQKEFDKFVDDASIPVRLIAGEDVAKFVLKHGSDLLFDSI